MAFDPNSVPMDLHQLNILRAMPEETRNSPVTASARNIEGYHVNTSPVYYPAAISTDTGFIRQQQYLPPGASAGWCPSPRMPAVGIGSPLPSSSVIPSSGYSSQTPTFSNRGSGGNSSDLTASDDGGEDSVFGRKVKFLCSFGGKVFPRPSDGTLRYVGGHTRIISVRKDVSFNELVQKMADTYGRSVVIKYQLPDEDLDALVSVSCPDDLENMMDEYEKLTEKSSDGSAKLRVFLFSSSDLDLTGMVHFGEMQDSGQKYVEAVNGLIPDVNIATVSPNQHSDNINGGSEVLDNVVSHVEPSGNRFGMSEPEQEPIIPVNFQPVGTYYLQTPAHFSAKPNNNMVQTSFLQPQGFNVYPHGPPVIPEGWVGQQQQAVLSEKIPGFMNCYTCESVLPRAYSDPVVQGHKESPMSNNVSDINQVYHTVQSDDMITGHLKNKTLLASSPLGVLKEDGSELDGRFSEFTLKDPFFQSSTTSEIFLPDFYNRESPKVMDPPTLQQLNLGIHSMPADQDSSIFSLVDKADGGGNTSNSLFSNQDPWNLCYNTHITIPKPNQHSPTSKGSAEEQIKQELHAVAEGVAASVLQASIYPNPSNQDLNGNNDLLMDQYQEDRERNPEENKQKLAEKVNFGFPVSDGIGRLQIIKNSDLEELQELGSGTFGTVYHAKWRGTDVAIKRINERCFAGKASEEQRMRDDFWNEAINLADLHHPNVVAFYGVVLDGPGGSVATVTEYMVNGSLRTALQKNEKSLDRRKRLLIAMDVAFGMEYLHGRNIVHFDLKSDNLLVNLRDPHRPICKVGDLGLSKVKCHTLISGGVRGTLPWMAPELLNGSSSLVSDKVDVFSFAIVMWELLTGEEPYADLHYGAIIGGIVSNTLRPAVPESCDPEWRLLMERCWSSEPSERPSFTDIANELRAMAAKAPQTSPRN